MDQPIGGMKRSALGDVLVPRVPETIADGVRAVARRYGAGTAGLREMPDFLVIGTKKGGTTSIANWLVQHPQVMHMFPRLQRHKSPHFFDINYWRGPRWYLSHFPSRAARTFHRRRVGAAKVGETSPYYLFHPAAAARIKETAPDARLIAVLREPVSRAHSNYFDRVVAGTETLPTFEEAIDAEQARLQGVTAEWLSVPENYSFSHDHHSYLARGRYAEQLRIYFGQVPRDQLLVLPLELLRNEPERAFRRIEDHVGLDHRPITYEVRNQREDKPALDPRTRDRLVEYYAEPNRQLWELLGEDYGW